MRMTRPLTDKMVIQHQRSDYLCSHATVLKKNQCESVEEVIGKTRLLFAEEVRWAANRVSPIFGDARGNIPGETNGARQASE